MEQRIKVLERENVMLRSVIKNMQGGFQVHSSLSPLLTLITLSQMPLPVRIYMPAASKSGPDIDSFNFMASMFRGSPCSKSVPVWLSLF